MTVTTAWTEAKKTAVAATRQALGFQRRRRAPRRGATDRIGKPVFEAEARRPSERAQTALIARQIHDFA